MSVEAPSVLANTIFLENLKTIQRTPSPNSQDTSIKEIPSTKERLRVSWPGRMYRILIKYAQSISLLIKQIYLIEARTDRARRF